MSALPTHLCVDRDCPSYGLRTWARDCRCHQTTEQLLVEQRDELLAILKRYVAEVPLGHQPHMLAHEAEALIAKAEGRP